MNRLRSRLMAGCGCLAVICLLCSWYARRFAEMTGGEIVVGDGAFQVVGLLAAAGFSILLALPRR